VLHALPLEQRAQVADAVRQVLQQARRSVGRDALAHHVAPATTVEEHARLSAEQAAHARGGVVSGGGHGGGRHGERYAHAALAGRQEFLGLCEPGARRGGLTATWLHA
jgi:hypothetical protein